ncbi:MAG: alginate export family protein [Alphaproteobacteria bacterium]|nr:alginate export family protein [Alphaproteobacteria bacterium]
MKVLKNAVFASTLPSAALLACIATLGAVTAKADASFDDFFDGGKFTADARYRFEHVDQDGFANDADAHTLRVRAGFQTGKVWDLQALIEGEGVVQFNDDFNDTVNGNVTFPTIADPEDFQINRLQIEYSGLPQTTVTLGRQRINLDNQRFVGGVAFRQNEQTFDALRIVNTSVENLTLSYAYVRQINRVFGEESAQGAFEGDTHLFNAGYDIKDWGKLTAYAYLIDLEDAPQATIPSTKTFGARFAGKHEIAKGFTGLYALEYATQSDYQNNTANYDVGYWLVEAGVAAQGFKLLGGIESLEGDGTHRFQTPLATLHKFQGYADVFLVTPPNGIVDTYGTLAYETKLEDMGPVTGALAAVTYHDFQAERGSASFGSETDIELVARLGDHWSAGIKYADYNGDGAFADRDKLWLSVDVTY